MRLGQLRGGRVRGRLSRLTPSPSVKQFLALLFVITTYAPARLWTRLCAVRKSQLSRVMSSQELISPPRALWASLARRLLPLNPQGSRHLSDAT